MREMAGVEQGRPQKKTSLLVEAQTCQMGYPSAFIQLWANAAHVSFWWE